MQLANPAAHGFPVDSKFLESKLIDLEMVAETESNRRRRPFSGLASVPIVGSLIR
jgi:hypothetical protein